MSVAESDIFAPAMGVRRPSEAEAESAGGTSGFQNLNLVRHGLKMREVS